MNEINHAKESAAVSDSVKSLQEEAKSLCGMLQSMDPGEPLWTGEDLQTILQHQLQAPLIVDLGGIQGVDADHVRQLASVRGLLLQSFEDLLCHAQPPVKLLILTKEFAKRNLVSPRSTIPAEVARVLYFSCIASAMLHVHRKITQLEDAEVLEGITWCLRREWLKPELRELMEQAADLLNREGSR